MSNGNGEQPKCQYPQCHRPQVTEVPPGRKALCEMHMEWQEHRLFEVWIDQFIHVQRKEHVAVPQPFNLGSTRRL